MLLERDRKLFHLFAVISIALSLLVCIPYSLEKVTLFEIIVKYMVIPFAVAVFTFMGWSAKYRSYRPSVKFTSIVTYVPLFSYSAAIIFNTVLLLVRNSAVYDQLKYTVLIIGLAAILVLVIALSHGYYKFVIKLSKNESLIADGIFAILALAYTFGGAAIALDYRAFGGLESKSVFFILIPLVLGIGAAWLHILVVNHAANEKEEYVVKSRQELYDLWESNCLTAKKIYETVREYILESLLNYNLDALGFEEIEENDTETNADVQIVADPELENKVNELENKNETLSAEKQALIDQNKALKEQLDEALAIIAQSKEKIVDTLQKCADNDADLIMDSLQHSLDVIKSEREVVAETRKKLEAEIEAQKAEIQAKLDAHAEKVALEEKAKAEAEEKARLDAERRAKEAEERAKEKKPIEPDFTKVVEFAVSVGKDRDDVELSVNEKQTMYKFAHNGTAFIVLQKTNNDYRISFLAKTEEMRQLLYEYNGVVSFDKVVEFDKAKYTVQQLKAVYKGDETISIEAVQNLLVNSLAVLLEAEDLEAQAIAKEQAAKERAKLAEQALREKEKALAKEEAKRQKELQKAEELAQKEQESSDDANPEEAA
ncbi:MAG: hypothetical protein E7183_03300 [Erysipelotrichaceae bacterium]|nr:hypothetical protein [Erysipelotrichaceae bacterium]